MECRIGGSMYYKTKIPVNNEPEFLASDKVVAFTKTIVPTGVTADEYGKKIVHKGSLIAESGKVVKITGTGDAVNFSEPPIGILMELQDVTYGEQPGAILVEGYVLGERLPLGVEYTKAIGAKIREVLPEIKFVNKEEA